jgi:predicted RNase H-like nuclease (RuvC/YqgF family)
MTLAQKSDRILAQTRGLSGATPNATQLIEELRWALEENRKEVERLRAERDEARRSLCRVESACRTVTVEEWRRNNADGITKWIPVEPERVAAERGWSCFKENGT